jgi:hypothetical protein
MIVAVGVLDSETDCVADSDNELDSEFVMVAVEEIVADVDCVNEVDGDNDAELVKDADEEDVAVPDIVVDADADLESDAERLHVALLDVEAECVKVAETETV